MAESVIVIVPFTVPLVPGVKATEIVQLAPAATLVLQLLLSEKLALAFMLVIARLAVPVLVSVMVWAGLVVLRVCVAKVRLVGDSVTAGLPAYAAADKTSRLHVAQTYERWLKLRKEERLKSRNWRHDNIPTIERTDLILFGTEL